MNFPAVSMERSGVVRLCAVHRNIPAMLTRITAQLSDSGINVENLSNKSRGDLAYTMIDLGSEIDSAVVERVRKLEHVIRVRIIR